MQDNLTVNEGKGGKQRREAARKWGELERIE
jgi:hypothetical protein